MPNLDDTVSDLVRHHGYHALLSALGRVAHKSGFIPVRRRIDKIVEWLSNPDMSLRTGRARRTKSVVG